MMLSFFSENQALEWQDRSEEDGIFSQLCGPERRYMNKVKVLDTKRGGIKNTEYMKQSRDSVVNVFD